MTQNKIQRAFDRAANTYDEHSDVQQRAGIKLTDMLKSFQPDAKHLLDMGCGTGMTTQYLASQYQYENFHAIDLSPALLAKAEQRLNKLAIKIYENDFDQLSGITDSFDIIYSNMAVQWSSHLSALLKNTHALLKDQGCIALSIPLAGTFTELHPHCTLNHLHNIDTIKNFMLENAYEILIHETESTTLAFSHPIHALKSIKHIGANHVHHRAHKGLNTKSHIKKIHSNQLTYVIGYFIARKS